MMMIDDAIICQQQFKGEQGLFSFSSVVDVLCGKVQINYCLGIDP